MTIINQKSISGITSITFASAGDDLLTFHSNNGTERFRIDNSGNTKITAGIVTTLTVTGTTTLNGNLDLQDNDKILAGTGDDLEFYHDGTHSHIVSNTGNLRILADGSGSLVLTSKAGEEAITCAQDGAVTIKHDNSTKFATTSTGVTITGTATATEGLVLDGQTGSGKGLRLDLAGSGDYVIQETTTDDVVQFGGTGSSNFFVHNISSGNIGIGTTGPQKSVHLSAAGSSNVVTTRIQQSTNNTSTDGGALIELGGTRSDGTYGFYGGIKGGRRNSASDNKGYLAFFSDNNDGQSLAERMRLDDAGRLLVNKTGSPSAGEGANAFVFIQGNTASNTNPAVLALARGQSASEISGGASLGVITFTDDAGNDFAQIKGATDGGAGTDDHPGRILFLTTGNNSSSPTEQARIGSDGFIGLQGTTASGGVSSGKTFYIQNDGHCHIAVDNTVPLFLNRNTSDGQIIAIRQNNTLEGNISVSGSTVSLQGAHLTRWSQLVGISTNVISDRPTILRGSVLSNLDEMCEWGDEDNEQLNCMKVSDVEGDPNVAGVFQDWDDDDDTYTNDLNCAMTGDFIIRIAQGTTVARGDLLMSAGDGTAKPQGDDIIRSKTIAKVTSTTVSTTYSDGSYCVPCVLMAC